MHNWIVITDTPELMRKGETAIIINQCYPSRIEEAGFLDGRSIRMTDIITKSYNRITYAAEAQHRPHHKHNWKIPEETTLLHITGNGIKKFGGALNKDKWSPARARPVSVNRTWHDINLLEQHNTVLENALRVLLHCHKNDLDDRYRHFID